MNESDDDILGDDPGMCSDGAAYALLALFAIMLAAAAMVAAWVIYKITT